MPRTLVVALASAALVFSLATGHGAPAPPPDADRVRQAVGRWSVEFANGVKEVCEVRKDRTATVVEPLRTSSGMVEVKDGSFIIVFQDDRVERWIPIGRRMIVEHWFPAAQFPSGTPVLGIAGVVR